MKPPRQLLLAAACLLGGPLCAGVRVIDLAQCAGAYDTQDMTPFIRELLAGQPADELLKIVFPRGVYHFRPDRAVGKYHCITNHDNGYRRFAFPIVGRRGVEIDGGGSEFLFHGRIIPFLIERSRGISLRNFTVDWPIPFTLEGRIAAVDSLRSRIELEIPDEFGYAVENGKLILRGEGWEERIPGENIVFDPRTRATAYRSDDYYIPKPDNFDIRAEAKGPGRVEIETRFVRAMPPLGSILTFKGVFTQNRHSPAIHATASSDITVEDVTIHHCGGMGLIAERSGEITVRRMRVVLRPGSPRMITTTADATHFCNCRGRVLIEACRFENMLDDATNVHGTYVRVVEATASDAVLVRIDHPQQAGYDFACAGDSLDVVDSQTLLPRHSVCVKRAERINEQYLRLTFTAPVGDKIVPGDGLENMSWYPELIFRNNIVRNNRARSILVSTPRRVLIEGNTFSSMMAALLIEGDMDHWYESGAVRDVTVRNNRFLDGTYGGADHPTILINPHLKKEIPGRPFERNIRIEGNLFRTFNEQLLRARSVGSLVFRNNTIEPSTTYEPYNDLPTIDLRSSTGVVIENNDYRKPGEMSIIKNSEFIIQN